MSNDAKGNDANGQAEPQDNEKLIEEMGLCLYQ